MKSSVVKRSVAFGGRKTSVSLEDAFWKALREIADRRQMTLGELIENINANRTQGNLSSAIRLYVLQVYQDQIGPFHPKPKGGAFRLVG
jgi:predicted DNA-binding ribbon-helix-helix protein